MRILSIIPARGGSKSIPRKNIINVGGKPLIAWSIKASLNCSYINKTVVSSEDPKILDISRKYGAEVVIRPKKLSLDSTLMEPVVNDCIYQLLKNGEVFDVFVLLQPTSPLRNSDDLNAAFEIFFKSKANALISGYEPEKSPFKAFRLNNQGFLEGLINNEAPFMNRQYLPSTFYPNGAIFIFYTKNFLISQKLFSSKTIPFYMSRGKSIDIDTIEDVKKISLILKNGKVTKNK